jgi:hypothetical protein
VVVEAIFMQQIVHSLTSCLSTVIVVGDMTIEMKVLRTLQYLNSATETRSFGKICFACFPYISSLFEIIEPNLM